VREQWVSRGDVVLTLEQQRRHPMFVIVVDTPRNSNELTPLGFTLYRPYL